MTPDAPTNAAPRRLDPRSVALMAVRKLPSLVFGIPLIATMSATGRLWLAVLVLVSAGVSVGALCMRWRSFTYAIGADDITITQGILTTNRRSIPLDRIQDVSIERRPLARLLGVATVRLETGGGETDEGVLDAVSLAEAERIRALLRGPRTATATTEIAQPDPERTIFAMDARRLAHMGAFGFSLVWLAAIGAAVQALGNLFNLDRDQIERTIGAAPDIAAQWASLLTIAATLLVVLVAGVIAGFVRTLLTQYGFRRTLADGRFRRVRGLLTRTEVVVGIARIQLALVERGPVSGRLGWAALRFQTLGGSNDAGGRQDMAPFARPPEVAAIVAAANLPAFDPLPLRPVAPGHVLRSTLINAGLPLVILLGVGIVFPPALFGLLLLPIPVGAALLARRHHRYALVGDSLQVAHGVLAQREWTVPRDAVQAVTLSRSWLQRRLDLVTVRVDTAGARGLHRPDIVDIAPAAAAVLAADLVMTEMKLETERDSDVATIHAPITEPTDERTFS